MSLASAWRSFSSKLRLHKLFWMHDYVRSESLAPLQSDGASSGDHKMSDLILEMHKVYSACGQERFLLGRDKTNSFRTDVCPCGFICLEKEWLSFITAADTLWAPCVSVSPPLSVAMNRNSRQRLGHTHSQTNVKLLVIPSMLDQHWSSQKMENYAATAE